MDEKVFFDEGNVRVTNARFIVDNHTYAMNGVTSVKTHLTDPDRKGPLGLILAGLVLFFVLDGVAKIVGLAVGGLGVWLLMQQKSTHAVVLNSASGEAQALTSQDEPYIGRVVAALNDALIHRG